MYRRIKTFMYVNIVCNNIYTHICIVCAECTQTHSFDFCVFTRMAIYIRILYVSKICVHTFANIV